MSDRINSLTMVVHVRKDSGHKKNQRYCDNTAEERETLGIIWQFIVSKNNLAIPRKY